MRWPLARFVLVLCLALAATVALTADLDSDAVDAEILKAANVPLDGPGLLAFFRKQTSAEPAPDKLQSLLRQLGDDSFEVRQKASAALVGLGATAEPFLKKTIEELKKATDADLEVLRRAEECLRRIGDRAMEAQIIAAAARMVGRRKPAGAAEALLAYLPGAPSEAVIEEVQAALSEVAGSDKAPDPLLLAALTDKLPLRRGIAGAALSKLATGPAREAVRKLLGDPAATVRLRVALALASAGEKQAVPVLIDLLGELAPAPAYQAEQFLCRLADEKAPAVVLAKEPTARTRCREAWAAWWKEHADTVEMGRLSGPVKMLGYTLLVQLDHGRVLELDAKNQVRWELKGIAFPLDAQLLPGGRILLAEQSAGKITERSLKGDILWEYPVAAPLMAQRLPNGNTFLATRESVLEVDRDGSRVFSWAPPQGDGVMRAQKLANGQFAVVTGSYQFKRLDPTGTRELQSFPVNIRTSGGRIDVLPNNHVLVPEKDSNRIVEHDTRGNIAWQVAVREPIAAVRLPNGNTLVTSMGELRAVEFNKQNEEVWQYRAGNRPEDRVTRAFRR